MSRRHRSSREKHSHRSSIESDADVARRRGIGLGAVLLGLLIGGLWLVVRGLM